MTTSLVCLPYAGGDSNAFRPWADRLPADVDLVTPDYPGHGRLAGSEPLSDLDAIVNHVLGTLAGLDPARCVLFGHSMGALVAFEAARRMRDRGPLALVASAFTPPQLVRGRPRMVTDEDALAYLRSHRQMPEDLLANREFIAMFLPPFRADLQALEGWTYRAEPPLACPLLVLTGTRDTVPVARMLQWRSQTSGPFSLRVLDGGHFFLREDPAATVSAVLALIDGLHPHGSGQRPPWSAAAEVIRNEASRR